jgi:hypothetical protein
MATRRPATATLPRGARAAGRRARAAAWRLATGLAAAAALLAVTSPARADDLQELELGKNRFEADQYADAAARFLAMLDASAPPCDHAPPGASGHCRLTDPELVARAREYAAASLIVLKRYAEADQLIEALLRERPGYSPNPAIFPQEVVDRFTLVRGRIRQELDAAARKRAEEEQAKRLAAQKEEEAQKRRIAELERLASTERVVVPSSRWVAFVPFGAGQFQNGDAALGWVFAVSEAVAGGTSIGLAATVASYANVDLSAKDPTTGQTVSRTELQSRIDSATLANRIAFSAWAGITVIGIVQAQIAFVPERVSMRPRPLPKPSVAPAVAPTAGGATFGLTGRF